MPKVNTPKVTRPAGRPITTGLGVPALVRLHPPLLDNLDAWISAQPEPRPSRPEAIRRILGEALGKPAAVKSPALPPASDAFLRALGHREENAEGPGVRLRKGAK
jgi:hypothetical protein